MRLTVLVSVAGELGKFNHDVTSRDVAFQDALLVVVKIAIQHGEVHTRLANPGAIMAGNAGRKIRCSLQSCWRRRVPRCLYLVRFCCRRLAEKIFSPESIFTTG